EVILRARERIFIARFLDLPTGSGPERVRSTHGVSVEAFVRTRIAGLLASVAKGQHHDAFGLAGQDPRRRGHFTVRKQDIDDVRKDLAVLRSEEHTSEL